MPPRKNIEDMFRLAELRGFKCVSTEYFNSRIMLKWQCHKGHIWETNPVNIYNGSGCPECGNRKRLTIEDMQKLAASRGGKCLSVTFVTNKVPLMWQCSKGHVWEARPDNVKNSGHWCPICISGKLGDNRKLTIEEMHSVAEERGGKCLSKAYIDAKSKLKWQCAKGHVWEEASAHIRNSGSWCPTCALVTIGDANRLTLEEMQELAEYKGGKCLSDYYADSKTEMKWKCEHGHTWDATAASLRSGYWCQVCSGRKRHSLETVQEYALSRGGKCLSETYENNRTKLIWRCAEDHIWEATFHDVKVDNTWCPHCFKFYSEEKVRFIFESLFNKPFRKNRKALGQNLELDGFNEELQLAFEYHGKQHYEFESFFYASQKEFDHRKHLDLLKEQTCLDKGIKLVSIPYNSYNSDASLSEYVVERLIEMRKIPNMFIIDISFNDFYKRSSVLLELRTLAESRDGKCLSTEYFNNRTKLKWQCSEGHIWVAKPNSIANGGWCPECSGRKKMTIEDCRAWQKN